MGENALRRIAALLDRGVPVRKIQDVRGTAYFTKDKTHTPHYDWVCCGDYETLKTDKTAYARAFATPTPSSARPSSRRTTTACSCRTRRSRR